MAAKTTTALFSRAFDFSRALQGIEFNEDGPLLISGMIKEEMGGNMDVSVLMGANVANEARMAYCSWPNSQWIPTSLLPRNVGRPR